MTIFSTIFNYNIIIIIITINSNIIIIIITIIINIIIIKTFVYSDTLFFINLIAKLS